MAQPHIYVYAIIQADQARPPYGSIGLDDSEVGAIVHGELAAIVSEIAHEEVRPRRAYLAAHHQVLSRLSEHSSPLPMAFGMIADDRMAVEDLLASYQQVLLEQSRRVAGRVEMALRVGRKTANIFDDYVKLHPQLRQRRDELFANGRQPTRQERIELGQMFDKLVQDDRADAQREAEDVLGPHCREIRAMDPRDETELLNLACLVDRDRIDAFHAAVAELDDHLGSQMTVETVGPLPAYNFVDVHVQLEPQE